MEALSAAKKDAFQTQDELQQLQSVLQDELQQVTRVLQQEREAIVALEDQLDLVTSQGVCV